MGYVIGAVPEEDPDGDGTAVSFNLCYPGQYYDAETGLHYNWHRYYDPTTGRYHLTSDPIGLDGGLARYVYANGNPVMYMDWMGLADATVDRGTNTLTVNFQNGSTISYPAANNASNPWGDPQTVGSNGPAPNGISPVQSPISTSNKEIRDERFGHYFWPIGGVDEKGKASDNARRRGIGLHGGRAGYSSKTHGCIRMNDDDIFDLHHRTQDDPLTHIDIR